MAARLEVRLLRNDVAELQRDIRIYVEAGTESTNSMGRALARILVFICIESFTFTVTIICRAVVASSLTDSSATIAKGWGADKGDIHRPLRYVKHVSELKPWQTQDMGCEHELTLSSGDVQASLQHRLEVPDRVLGGGDDRAQETLKRIDVQRHLRYRLRKRSYLCMNTASSPIVLVNQTFLQHLIENLQLRIARLVSQMHGSYRSGSRDQAPFGRLHCVDARRGHWLDRNLRVTHFRNKHVYNEQHHSLHGVSQSMLVVMMLVVMVVMVPTLVMW